jgi:hypothetical protein
VFGVIVYALSDKPFTIPLFNAFVLRLLRLIPKDGRRRFMLIDNASFHAIDYFVRQEMETVTLGVTHTAPSTCAFDPIEEFFAHAQQIATRKYEDRALTAGQIIGMTRVEFKELICESVDEAGARDLSGIFARAGLMAAPPVAGPALF